MTLIGAILKRVQSKDSMCSRRLASPPPELQVVRDRLPRKRTNVDKFKHVSAVVDPSPPRLDLRRRVRQLRAWRRRLQTLLCDNWAVLTGIKCMHFQRGKVDSHWDALPLPSTRSYENRVNFLKKLQAENKYIYKGIVTTPPKVDTAAEHSRCWSRNRREMVRRARAPFVLFPPERTQLIEDPAFRRGDVVRPSAHKVGVTTSRVRLGLRIEGAAALGALHVELFAESCPQTCALFLELLDGDQVGHGYVGTRFFRKVPGLYWRGGDVVHDNGFGCYAPRGRRRPIGAENYHFSHSMPGLLSMCVTRDDEMCGSFNITFKPLPQFDLHNVVFGRVIRPSATFDCMCELGSAYTPRPVVRISETRRRDGDRYVCGAPNTRLPVPRQMLKNFQKKN